MVTIPKIFISAVLSLALGCVNAFGQSPPSKKVLFFSKSSAFEHSAIHRTGTNLSVAESTMQRLGGSNHIEFTLSKDGRLFTPEKLAVFDAFLFYTTGDLTESGTDHNPPMTPEGKTAFLEAIRNGKGFVGVHSASDTFHSPGNKDIGPARFQNDGTNIDPYIQMLGGEFIIHGSSPQFQTAHMICADAKFPGMAGVPADFGPTEEWYSLKNFASDLHVILVQDTSTMQKAAACYCYDRPPYPATWAHRYGQGRVFYTNMGHREDVWSNPVYQQILLGAVDWALHNVDADITPNLQKVTPEASVLPKYQANP
jgi:type 1 glutamine amidotransferase